MQNTEMVFPKDADASGSWISLCANGNAGVLLNGAFEKHERNENYRLSRGVVFLDIMDNTRPVHRFIKTNLDGVEPFTLIVWHQNNLYECRWDEKEKYCKNLPAYRPYIWSSCTLYDEEVRKKRELWFLKWLNRHPVPTQQQILGFHRFAGEGDMENDLVMNRNGKVFTVSITSLMLQEQYGKMIYTDLISERESHSNIFFANHSMAA